MRLLITIALIGFTITSCGVPGPPLPPETTEPIDVATGKATPKKTR